MIRKLLALLFALLLCALPALAEVAEPCDIPYDGPVLEDFLGHWDVIYAVTNGRGEVCQPGEAHMIMTEKTALLGSVNAGYNTYSYLIDGPVLKVGSFTFHWVGDNVMLYRSSDVPDRLCVMQRTAPMENPFVGDWEVALCFSNGEMVTASTTMVTFTETTVEWDLTDSDETVICDAVYKDGVCSFGVQSAVIDESGAMIVTGGGEVVILLPIIY